MSMTTYGLTQLDLEDVKRKIKRQSDYLENNKFITDGGQTKSLLDISFSANLSTRYYPQILNKVDTFVSTAVGMNLVPLFLTVTLDGFFRDMMKGDYTRFNGDNVEKYLKHIPNNERSGFYWNYIKNGSYSDLATKKSFGTVITPKDLYKILGHQLFRFNKSKTFQNIRKNGFNYSMIRVTEPHKSDGVPHLHMLLYVPQNYVLRVYDEFIKCFPAPRNHVVLKKNNKHGSRDGEEIAKGIYETYGFQSKVRSPAGYILKYILKSFRNLVEEKEVDYLQAWYVHNRIPRIITTHTLVSQSIYHKVSILDDDWHYLTDVKNKGGLDKDIDNNYFKFDDGHGRIIIGDSGVVVLSNNKKTISYYGTKKHTLRKVRLRSLKFSSNKPTSFNLLERFIFYKPPKPYNFYITKLYDDGTLFSIGTEEDFFMTFDIDFIEEEEVNIAEYYSVSKMKSLHLFNAYYSFDFDVNVPAKYAVIHNELIDRGLIIDKYLNPNDFNTSFDYD